MIRIPGLCCVVFCLALRGQAPAAPANSIQAGPTRFAGSSLPGIIPVFNLTGGWTSVIQGSDGNFYALSSDGTGVCQDFLGSGACGAVIKVTPGGALSVLYSFQPGPDPTDTYPFPSQLIQGTDGNLYGTTARGGTAGCTGGCGTFFKLTPSGTFTTLYSFNSNGGNYPDLGLVEGNDGNFYGVTSYGGSVCQFGLEAGCGTVYTITPQGAFASLYTFDSKHGANPSSLIKGADGNFYGTASYGGNTNACPSYFEGVVPNGCGTVFKLTSTGSITTLYTFQGASDGNSPAALIQANDGNFYGVASAATFPLGSVFKLIPDGTLTTFAAFDNTNGATPNGIIQATDGNLYGTTPGVGGVLENGAVLTPSVGGTLFQISLSGTLTVLYNFCQSGCQQPNTIGAHSLLLGSDGNLYGISNGGGTHNFGEFFEYPLVSSNAPAISASNGIQNGASFQSGIPSGSWMTIKGTNLSANSDTWNNSIVNGALPTQLDGVKVTVGGQPAYLEYVSSIQINAIAPSLPAGPAQVVVTNSNGTSQAVSAQVSAFQPAFFEWGNYAVATRQDFSYAVKTGTFPGTTTIAAKPGDVIILWGTGFGPTSPAAPAGMETPPTSTYNTANQVSVTIGTVSATVYGAALAPGYAGLYQIAIQIPSSLPDGDYPLVATVNGVQSPSSTMITVSVSP